jgi:uncharacterized protein involved in exopolysaccharide biosynthesis/Mrp family chromosome partitioning ATPase
MKYIAQPELKRLIRLYLKNWKLFALSIAGCMVLAVAFLLIKNPTYNISASVLVKDETSSSSMGMMSAMMRGSSYGDLLGMGGTAVDDEIVILGSYSTIYATVQELQLNINYMQRKFLRKQYYFRETPIRLIAENPAIADTLSFPIDFKVKVDKQGIASVRATAKIKHRKVTLADLKGELPMTVETTFGTFTLEKTQYLKPNKKLTLHINYSGYPSTTELYQKKLDVDFASKKSNVMVLLLRDTDKDRGKTILNTMVDRYNEYSLDEKNRDASRMSQFLEKRIALLKDELTEQDLQLEAYKKEHDITDIGTELKAMLENSTDIKQRRLYAEEQLAIIRTTQDFIKDPENKDALIPVSLCATNGEMSGALNSYNGLLTRRQTLLRSSRPDNPAVIRLNDELEASRQTLIISLADMRKIVEKNLQEYYADENKMIDKMKSTPTVEREFYGMSRSMQVTNTMYIYLLQQQANNDMNLDASAPKTQIVDRAYASVEPASPKKKIVLAGALLVALLLPVLYLRVHRAVKPRIESAFDLSQELRELPIYTIASEADNTLDEQDPQYENDLNSLRSSIHWKEGEATVVLFSSIDRSTGKSKHAYHLAKAIAGSHRRTLLLDADLRYSILGATTQGHTQKEHTLAYLLQNGKTIAVSELLRSASEPNLALLPATDGLSQVTRPTDLLQSPQWGKLLASLRQEFDAIVIDTTALNEYPDTLPLFKEADNTYFVFTENQSTKQSVYYTSRLIEAEAVPSPILLLNRSQKNIG